MKRFHYQNQILWTRSKDCIVRRKSAQILKLCLYGPCTNFNLATATRETNTVQNCRGLVAEKSAINRGLCLKRKQALRKMEMAMPTNLWSYPVRFDCWLFFIPTMSSQKNTTWKTNPEGWKKTTSLRYAKHAQPGKTGMKTIKHYRSSTAAAVSMLSNLSWYKTEKLLKIGHKT